MIPAVLCVAGLALCALILEAAQTPAVPAPERGQLWITEVGARARVLGTGATVLLEIEDLEIAGLWGLYRVPAREWAWIAERWEYTGEDPDLLIPPPADGGAA